MKKSIYKEFACDLCHSQEAVEVPHSREYSDGTPLHICKECGFVHVKKRRSTQQIADAWSEEIYGAGYSALTPHVLARQTFVAAFVHENLNLKGKTLCDIGAGEGQFLDIVRGPRFGASVFGIEPSRHNCKRLDSMGIANFHGNLESFLANKQSRNVKADIVTIMWTLENCQDPAKILQGAYQLLKDDGHVVIATGSRILVPFKKPLHTYISKNPADTHSSRFSRNTLEGFLATSHFKTRFVNRYIDNDILCAIGKKRPLSEKIKWTKDNYLDVYSFFERWHADTSVYFPERV